MALEGFSKPFRIERNKNGVASCLLFVNTRLISIEKAPTESFFTELNSAKRILTIPTKNTSSHLEAIRRTMDIHSFNCDNFIFSGDLNADVSDKAVLDICESYNLKSLINQPTRFYNSKNPSCIALFLTSRSRDFRSSYVIEARLSDFLIFI